MVIRGRDPVLDMLRDLIVHRSAVPRRTGKDTDTWGPLVPILVGPGGSGRTALLTELAGRLNEQPYVVLDAARMADPGVRASIPDLLTTMVFELVRRGGRRWRFSRYIVGRLVTEMDLDGTDVAHAHNQVCAELARVKDPEALGRRLAGLLRLLPPIGGQVPAGVVEPTISLIVRGLTQWRMGRTITLRSGQDWYGYRHKEENRDPIAELVNLNRMAKWGNEDARAEVVQVLMAAFLADVREAAQRGRAVDPVLLLDNADNEPAVDFLNALNAVRAAPNADHSPDHLTVIATSNGALLRDVGIPDDQQPLDDVGIKELRAGGVNPPERWLPVALRDLTDEEIKLMASDIQLPAVSRHCVVRAVSGLTHGHPLGSQLLLQAAAADADSMNLQALLRARVPGSRDGIAIGERILNSMLRPLTKPLRDDLITCAAARTQDEAELLAGSGLLKTDVRDRKAVLSRAYWSHLDCDSKSVMHPLLRRLLLWQLAAPDREGSRGWATVFGWLAKNGSQTDDGSGTLHHALALGEVAEVTTTLVELLAIYSGESWLRLVKSLVTTAVPTFLTDSPVHTVRQSAADALAQQTEVVDGRDRFITVATLLTAWQAASDPLVTLEKADLHAMVATGLDAVIELACGGFSALSTEADEHRTLVRLWRGCGASQISGRLPRSELK